MIQWIGILLTIVCVVAFVYSKYLEFQKDIHELALNEQSNISPTRKADETAIYRNNQVPHGMPLATGLQIRQGFRLRDGNIRDIWSVVMSQKRQNTVSFIKSDTVTHTVSIDHLNAAFKRLQEFFRDNSCQNIGIAVPLFTYEGFLSCFTCFVYGLTAHHFNHLPRTQVDLDIIIVSEDQLQFALKLDIKLILVVTDVETKKFAYDHVFNWFELGDLASLSDDIYEYKYDPEYDEGIPLKDTCDFITTTYTHRNFVSAVTSIVKTIPLGHELTENDHLLVAYEESKIPIWPKVFALLLFGGSISLCKGSDLTASLIESHKPTILAVNSRIAKQALLMNVEIGIKQKIFKKRTEYLFSEGIFSDLSQSPSLRSVRLIYIDQLNSTRENLTSSELNQLRVISGARIICERFIPGVLGSILCTNFYDYRVFSNQSLKNCGTSSLSLEIKLFKHQGLDIDRRHGELCIRGFIIGRPYDKKQLEEAIDKGERVGSEGWLPTGLVGRFGVDGCFYED